MYLFTQNTIKITSSEFIKLKINKNKTCLILFGYHARELIIIVVLIKLKKKIQKPKSRQMSNKVIEEEIQELKEKTHFKPFFCRFPSSFFMFLVFKTRLLGNSSSVLTKKKKKR